MNGKAIFLFLLLFLAVGYGMSLVTPSLPNLGNPTYNWAETSGISAVVIIFAWEKWLRKDAITKKDG